MVKVLDRESINRMTRNSGRGGSTYVGGGGGGGYTLPLAADGTRGGVQIGYTTDADNRNYAVQLNNEKMYVNVPWVNTEDRLKPLGDITYGANYLQFKDVHASAASNPANAIGNPSADWYHHIIMNHGNDAGYFVDMALCFHTNEFYYRRIANGSANAWVRVIDSSNIGNQSVNYATSAGSAGYAASASQASNADTVDNYHASDLIKKGGDTMTGTFGLRSNAYGGPSGTHGLNCNNSDIVGVNSIYTSDESDSWDEGIEFYRGDNGNWDSLRAYRGTWYFYSNNGSS